MDVTSDDSVGFSVEGNDVVILLDVIGFEVVVIVIGN